jgi:hypothetical protein
LSFLVSLTTAPKIATNSRWNWRERKEFLNDTVSWERATELLRLPADAMEIVSDVVRGAWEPDWRAVFALSRIEFIVESLEKLAWRYENIDQMIAYASANSV